MTSLEEMVSDVIVTKNTNKLQQNLTETEAFKKAIIEELQGSKSPEDLKALATFLKRQSKLAFAQHMNLV